MPAAKAKGTPILINFLILCTSRMNFFSYLCRAKVQRIRENESSKAKKVPRTTLFDRFEHRIPHCRHSRRMSATANTGSRTRHGSHDTIPCSKVKTDESRRDRLRKRRIPTQNIPISRRQHHRRRLPQDAPRTHLPGLTLRPDRQLPLQHLLANLL